MQPSSLRWTALLVSWCSIRWSWCLCGGEVRQDYEAVQLQYNKLAVFVAALYRAGQTPLELQPHALCYASQLHPVPCKIAMTNLAGQPDRGVLRMPKWCRSGSALPRPTPQSQTLKVGCWCACSHVLPY